MFMNFMLLLFERESAKFQLALLVSGQACAVLAHA
jgi:hypothetical protein